MSLSNAGFRSDVHVSDDVTDDMSVEFRENALLFVYFQEDVQIREDEQCESWRHKVFHDSGK